MLDTKREYEDITSIHIYSLEPGPLEVWMMKMDTM